MLTGIGKIIEELEKIKNDVSLTDYEKARRPLQNEILELQKENRKLKNIIYAHKETLDYIIKSIENETIGVIVRTDNMEVKAFNKKNQDLYISTKAPFEIVKVPIKQELRKDISKKINECLEQYNYYERSNIL